MKIAVTGSTSGVGQALVGLLEMRHEIIHLNRAKVDLGDPHAVMKSEVETCDMLINCAGTDRGGKIEFVQHNISDINEIMSVNLLAPLCLTQQALSKNPNCKIVNITSTNNNRYWPNNLAYSLSKTALEEFGSMLRVEYPDIDLLEVRLGLTKTNFNQNRYHTAPTRFVDIYEKHPYLTPEEVAIRIVAVLFDPVVKFIEISP
jgi:short-subunit dehydrogenase